MGVYLKKNSISGTLVKACVGEVHRFIGKVIGKVKSEALELLSDWVMTFSVGLKFSKTFSVWSLNPHSI